MSTEFSGSTAWARNLAAPVRDYLRTETGGALVLLGATVVALLWANSPWWDSYESFWGTELAVSLGDDAISMDLRTWVNEGLMTFFFLVVGLEAKREMDVGEMRERRSVAIPLLAAVGGMLVPVAIYLALNAGHDSAGGWGAAMSTDTAFALGALALVAGGATRLRVRLLTLVVFDDLVALVVIATVYTDELDLMALAISAALFALLVGLRFAPVTWRRPAAVALGVAIWLALHQSGVDPVIAGLAVGLITSAYPPARAGPRARDRGHALLPRAAHARAGALGAAQRSSAISANERLQHRLHPWTSYAIVPLFAIANAGIHLDGDLLADAAGSPITLGILLGYVIGKPVGIATAAWLGSRSWLGGLRLAAELADDRRRRLRGRDRVHGLAADLEPRLRAARTWRRRSSACSARPWWRRCSAGSPSE